MAAAVRDAEAGGFPAAMTVQVRLDVRVQDLERLRSWATQQDRIPGSWTQGASVADLVAMRVQLNLPTDDELLRSGLQFSGMTLTAAPIDATLFDEEED